MPLAPSLSSSAHSVYVTSPPSSILNLDFSQNPPAISPPVVDRTISHPFNIRADVYHFMLHIGWPTAIAIVYALTVQYVNRINKRRGYKPWGFSKSEAFFFLVIAHNTLLALYSGWTFAGMARAFLRSWPGLYGDHGLAGAADALCKLHGPRGAGSAATYNMEYGSWSISDITMRLAGGSPDSTDIGRIWNEGLAYYGWIFYLSKFYEVFDTAIILTKGKKSSFLQTYHHTGAMFAMWAGIRYMSPPIWMFTFINSGIHTLMYTYYTISAATIRVPAQIKQTLTFLQIFQIIFGASYALSHLFIAYDVPYYVSYRVVNNLSTVLPSAASAASSALTAPTSPVDINSWLKKAVLRAAGEEGLAENVRNYKGETFGIDAVHAAQAERAQEEIIYKLSTTKTHCLDTSGETFAIVLNLFYLAPLAYLFIKFFARYFSEGAKGDPPRRAPLENTKTSAGQAAKDVEAELKEAMNDRQGGITEPPQNLKAELEDAKGSAKQTAKDLNESAQQKSKYIGEKLESDLQDLRARGRKGIANTKDKVTDAAQNSSHTVKEEAQTTEDETTNDSDEAKDQDSNDADSAKEKPTNKIDKQGDDEKDGPSNGKDSKEENKADKEPKKEGDAADASAYEVNPNSSKTEDEIKAEEKNLQPNVK